MSGRDAGPARHVAGLPSIAWSFVPALAALAVYLVQAPPVSGDKDASEFTLVLALHGVAHPTGYPLYTLLGHFFVLAVHGLGATWAYAANAWSAVGGAVAVFFLHRLGVRLGSAGGLDPRSVPWVALLPVGLFAFNPMWTMETTLAEVYSWHVAWACGVADHCVGLVRALDSETGWTPARQRRRAAVWGVLCGLGLAHHLTSVLVSVPLSVVVAIAAGRRRLLGIRTAMAALAGAALPVLSYGTIAYRAFHPTLAQWPILEASWSHVLDHVTGTQYRGYMGSFDPSSEQRHYLAVHVYPFLFPAIGALVAAAWLARGPQRAALTGMAGAAVLGTVYAFNYGVFDPSSYFMMPLVLGLAGAVSLLASVRAAGGRGLRAAPLAGPALALVAAVLLVPWLRLARDRRQVYLNFETLVRGMWDSIPFEEAIVIWPDDMSWRLREYQWLAREKPGIDVENPWNLANTAPRSRFTRKHGFDPWQGVNIEVGPDGRPLGGEGYVEAFYAGFARNLSQQARVPVILFDPKKQSVRLLQKDGGTSRADSTSAPGPSP